MCQRKGLAVGRRHGFRFSMPVVGALLACVYMFPAFGDTDAGIEAFKAGNYEKALEELKPAAESGDAEAQFYLARMYDHGMEVPKDSSVAYRWYLRAAEAGLPEAQATVGYSLDEGIGVERDDMEAAVWYRRAGKQGHVIAQRNLGLMYQKGEGVDFDEGKAARWFRRAAEQGDAVAQTELGHAYWMGYGVESDKREALDLLRSAAEQDHAKAQYLLCSDLTDLYPQHSPRLVRAMMWCRLAADQDHPGAERMWEAATRWFVTGDQKKRAARDAERWAARNR